MKCLKQEKVYEAHQAIWVVPPSFITVYRAERVMKLVTDPQCIELRSCLEGYISGVVGGRGNFGRIHLLLYVPIPGGNYVSVDQGLEVDLRGSLNIERICGQLMRELSDRATKYHNDHKETHLEFRPGECQLMCIVHVLMYS